MHKGEVIEEEEENDFIAHIEFDTNNKCYGSTPCASV